MSEPIWQNKIVRYAEEAPDQLLANPANFRLHPKNQQEALSGVLNDVGWISPIICNEVSGHVIDGHLRVTLALRNNLPTVPVIYVHLTPAEEAEALATHDPLSAMAGTDAAKLDDLLREVSTDSPALQQMLDELAVKAGIVPGVGEPGNGGDEFDTMPDDGPTRTQIGELWVIGGKHRLIVGDSTDAATVARLMDGELVDIYWSDPPYNVDYEGKTADALKIENDVMAADDYRPFLARAFAAADAVMKPGAVYYIAHPDIFAYEFIGATRDVGWQAARPAVVQWVKDAFVFGRGDYHSRSEPMLYGWKPGAAHHAVADRTQDNVWEIPRPKASEDHPTMKPVELVERALRNSSDRDDAVLDSFGGSGTTLIAAHRTNRRAYLCELSPKYADVILRRAEAEGLTVELLS